MPVKDKVVSWFIQNVIVPRREIIDQPGFVITTFTDDNQTTYLRDPFYPEKLYEMIEKTIVEKYGIEGKQALYSAGKKFGYLYSNISNFPTINTCSEKQLSEFSYYLVRYIASTYATNAEHEIDISKKEFLASFQDYIICRHNGLGHIMTDGAIAGTWAYAMQEKSIEGIQTKCQGRGNNECVILCAPVETIKNKSIDFFCETDLPEYTFDEVYKIMNKIRPTNYSKNSLKDLLDVGFFNHKHGILSYNDMRFFQSEAHILYLIENEISKLNDGANTLFRVCYDFCKILRQTYGEKDYEFFISDFFPALGFGDITFISHDKEKLASIYYPWTLFSEKSKYIIFRGLMSGIITDSINREVFLNNFEIDIEEYLTLTISE